MRFWRRQEQRGLTASVTVHDGPQVQLGQTRGQKWQQTAWDFWGRLGELHYPTTQIARLMTRISWQVFIDGRELKRDTDQVDETDQFLAAVSDPLGIDEAVRQIALSYQVAGEVWYVNRGEDEGWQVVSVADPELPRIRQDTSALRLRGMIPDPRDRRVADSPFQPILGPAEELLTLEALSRSQSRSRMSQAGILLRPSEAEFPQVDENGNQVDSFGEDLERAMTAPIRDEYDPSALVPLDLEVPGETIQQFRHLTFGREYDERLQERIERAIGRIAVGLDIPPSLLLGIADLNHWNAWLVQEDTYRGHVEPLALRVGEILSTTAETLEIGSHVEVLPDPTDLLARRSSVRDAMDAARLGAVGLEYVRDVIGAGEDDAPSDEELEIMRGQQGGGRNPNAEERPGPPSGEGSPVAASTQGAVDLNADLEEMGRALSRLDADLRSRLIGAIERDVDDAMRRLGAKLRTELRNRGKGDQVADVSNAGIASELGEGAFELVDVEASVRDSLRGLGEWWGERIDDAHEQIGEITGAEIGGDRWQEAKRESVRMLVDELVRWVTSDVAGARRAPSERLTLTDLAREVVAVAGGSER